MPWAGMSTHPLSGSVVAVVGATGALGSRIARAAADRGAHVVLVGRDEARLRQVVERAPVVTGDLSDPALGDRVVAAAVERHGGLDGLVNAAGVVAFGALLDTDDEVLEELFLTNVLGPLLLCVGGAGAGAATRVRRAAERGGGRDPASGIAADAASKAALTAADRALARVSAPVRVYVIDVRPPHTETGLAGRPRSGTAPALPPGLDPDVVVTRVLDAIEAGRSRAGSTDFD